MTLQNLGSFVLILFALFLYTIPLGFLFIKNFNLFKEKELTWWDLLTLSLGFGVCFFVLICFFLKYIQVNFILLNCTILAVDGLLLYFGIKNKKINFLRKKSTIGLVAIFFLILFLYYSVVPLTNNFAITRDYDIFAVGLKQTSRYELPFYGVEIYYPPGGSLLAGFLSFALPFTDVNKIILNLSYFFMFLLFALIYQVGNLAFDNKKLGFFLAIAFSLVASTRNFVSGGATYPAILSSIFVFCSIITLFQFLKKEKKTFMVLCGIFLGGAAVSHFDTSFNFIWGFFALFISLMIFQKKNWKKILKNFFLIGIIAIVISSPFLIASAKNRSKIAKAWSSDAVWEAYAHGEIHPKPLSEIMFFDGKIIFVFALIGIFYLIFLIWKKQKFESIIGIFLLLWFLFLFLSNSMTFLRLARPFVLFYAINIIMWWGITLPLTIAGGFGFFALYKEGFLKLFSEKKSWVFLVICLLISLVVVADYETLNKQKVFARHGGFLKMAFAQRNTDLNDGDLELIYWLKNHDFDGIILNTDDFGGHAVPTITEKKSVLHFYHVFYDNPEKSGFMTSRQSIARTILQKPNSEEAKKLIEEENIAYIFLPGSISATANPELLTGGNYEIVKRNKGSKILRLGKGKLIDHVEVEDYVKEEDKASYTWGMRIALFSAKIKKGNKIEIKLNSSEIKSDKARIYIKHSTFIYPLKFKVKIGDFEKMIDEVSDKLQFSETYFDIDSNLLEYPLEIIGESDEMNFLGFEILPEIDWIEVEELE